MRTAEVKALHSIIAELRAEVRELRAELHQKIDHAVKKVSDAFEGFGILDPNEETWTEAQVCERYHVTRRTMYKYRQNELLPFIKKGTGRNCKITYRKADVVEFFASQNG